MSAQRAPVYMGLILLISTAGCSAQSPAPADPRPGRGIFQLMVDKVRHVAEQRADGSDNLPRGSNKQRYSGDTKEVHDYKSYPDDHVLGEQTFGNKDYTYQHAPEGGRVCNI